MPEVKKSGLIKTNTNSVNETYKTPSEKKEEKKVTHPIASAAVKKAPVIKATLPEVEDTPEEKKITPLTAIKKASVAKYTPPEAEDKPVKPVFVAKKIEEKK